MKNIQEWAEVELLSHNSRRRHFTYKDMLSLKNISKAEHVHANRLYEVLDLKANEFLIK